MEPRRGKALPEDRSYAFQIKWDGIRILAYWDGSRLLLRGKSLKDKTASYPELGFLPELLGGRSFILDGELIALKGGKPCFFTLMERENSLHREELSSRIPVYYMVFDLLLWNGEWLMQKPWTQRQNLLGNVLGKHEFVHLTENYSEGDTLLAAVAEKGLEGVVAKQRESLYVPGPRKSSYWIKTKLQQTLEAGVGGVYLKENNPVSLLLGLQDEKDGESGFPYTGEERKMRFIGSVSSGLTQRELLLWLQWARDNSSPVPLFSNPPPLLPGRDVVWTKPRRQVRVLFSEWTPGLKLRSPRLEHCSP